MSERPARSAAPGAPPKKTPSEDLGKSAAELITQRIVASPDWRGALLARLRALILAAHPDMVEDWKWNVPVWCCRGIVCTGETYRQVVKLTFPQGAALPDASRVFNASLEGRVRRAIDFRQGAEVDEAALTALVRAAVAHNQMSAAPRARGAA